jgi:hypothetical protein
MALHHIYTGLQILPHVVAASGWIDIAAWRARGRLRVRGRLKIRLV